jgi:hypothetical protein
MRGSKLTLRSRGVSNSISPKSPFSFLLLILLLDPLAALDDDKLQAKLDRHQTRLQRVYYKALKVLSALQTERILVRITKNEKAMGFSHFSPLLNTAELRRMPSARAA